jgi:hypothetical protein
MDPVYAFHPLNGFFYPDANGFFYFDRCGAKIGNNYLNCLNVEVGEFLLVSAQRTKSATE